jgi:4-amino-4-deoxy-L-arabinose transferase-like glycosyltransferase
VFRRDLASLATWATLGLALALNGYLQSPYLTHTEEDWDAVHLYQPLAKGLLEGGASFFTQEASLRAPPFSYGYQALLGASLPPVRWANLVLSALTLCLLFRCGWLLHSRLAGLAAAMLFALCPILKEFIVAPLTEGPFIFLCACWFWAMCEWFRGGRRAFVGIAAVALTLAVLTRATLLYWILIAIVAFAWLALRRRDEARRRARGALAAHVIALVAPAAFTAKNLAVFGIGFIATGAGNALYQGNHPVTHGYDGPFVGLVTDVGQITRVPDHLELEAEKRLMKVARGMIRDSDPAALAGLHANKLAAFLFVTNAYPRVLELRSWRIALFILAAIGFAGMRDPWMRGLLGAILAYQVASYVPVLYTHRYSVTMDPWLMIASGVGVASLWSRRRPREMVAAAGAIAIGIAVGRDLAQRMDPPEPDIYGGARMLVWKGEPRRITFEADHPVIDIPIPNSPWFHPWNGNVLLLDAALTPAPGDDRCGEVRFTYRRDAAGTDEALVRHLVADGRMHRRQFGAVPIRLNAPGTLRIELRCARGGSLELGQIAVYTPVAGIVYAQRYLGLPPPLALPIEE